jgi:hypothetical protein
MFVTNQCAAELTEPGIGAFDLSAPFIPPQLPAVFIPSLLVVLPVGRNQFPA